MKVFAIWILTACLGRSFDFSPGTDDLIASGPKEGQTVRLISRAEVSAVCPPPADGYYLPFRSEAGVSNLFVRLSAYRWECVRVSKETERAFACYEFQVRARGSGPWAWSCWAPDYPQPHNFTVIFTPQVEAYFCYVADGVHLFRSNQERESQRIRQRFWNNVPHPDALPVLPISMLFESFGVTNLLGLGPQSWNVTVDGLRKKDQVLFLTVHGQKTNPKCTFALESGKWSLVSKQDGD